MENVAALVTQKFLPLFSRWQGVLEKLGYANYAQVLNSKNYGVPQNRKRIFLVSVRSDCRPSPYYFPKPFPLDSRLKDVLEEDVDDSFYLSDATVHKFIEHCDRKQLEGCGFKFEPSTPPPQRNSQSDNLPQWDEGNGQLPCRIGSVNSSQDGQIFSPNAISPCHTSGHGNTPKIITTE